jgi:FHA domain
MLLIFTSESPGGKVVEINRSRLTIGRVADNDVQLSDEKVSRHHAVIELQDDGRVLLRDLDSRNGSFVDGVRLAGARILNGGEQLRFGDQQLRVDAGPVSDAPERAQPEQRTRSPRRPIEAAARLRGLAAMLRTRRAALVLIPLALLALLGIAQLVLPGVAEDRLRSKLERYGLVRRLHIDSTPAIKLLWHRADRVEVAMETYRSEPGGHGSLADFLSRTRETAKLDVSVGILESQLLALREVRLHKEGDLLVGQALLSQRDLSAALPTYLDLRPVSASAEGIVVQASASVFGQRVRAQLRVLADRGRVVVRPEGIPFGSLATISVFNDPRVYVESLGAELHGEQYLLTVRARLR